MNRKLGLVLVVGSILAVAVGAYFFVIQNNDSQDSKQSSNVTNTESNQSAQPSTQAVSDSTEAGKYVDYSSEVFASTSGNRVLFFHAPWCPQCKQLDSSIKSGTVPSGMTIFKVDYDSNQKLRQQYGVTLQTTLVLVDQSGKEIKKFVAYDEPNLESVVKNLQ